MRKLIKTFLFAIALVLLSIQLFGCSLENGKNTNKIYFQFYNKLYYKGVLYSNNPSLINTTFYFPILSTKKIEYVENVFFYDKFGLIDANIIVVPNTRDDRVVNSSLYLNLFEFKLNIKNIEGKRICGIRLTADGKEVEYLVDIMMHYYYINPEFNLVNLGDFLYDANKSSCSLVYGYESLSKVSMFKNLESMVDGIAISKLSIANGKETSMTEGGLPWDFKEIENGGENILAYKNNILRIDCNYSQIKDEAVFLKMLLRQLF